MKSLQQISTSFEWFAILPAVYAQSSSSPGWYAHGVSHFTLSLAYSKAVVIV
jgi:hypothetical protein